MAVTNIYGEYARNAAEIHALKAKIAEYELKQDQLKPHIIEMMTEQGAEKIELDIGKFTITRLKSWSYPEAVVDLGEEFKAAKAKAESTGEATYEVNESLRYTPVKL